MPDNLIPLLHGTGVVVMAALALIASWLLSGRRFPQKASRLMGWGFLIGLWGLGGFVLVSRYVGGLGAVTHLSDLFPWGIWKGTVLWGIAISAGGFVTAGSVYIFRIESLHPVLRPAVLTAYLGYIFLGVGSLIIDIGRSYRIWHPIIYWQHHSLLFEVAWCIILYTIVLTVEFSPILLERLGWTRLNRIIHALTIPFVIAGVILSTLHQSSLGGLFLIVPRKLLPLWYSPFLHLFFFLSAITVGLSMMVVVFTLSTKKWAGLDLAPKTRGAGRDPRASGDAPTTQWAGKRSAPATEWVVIDPRKREDAPTQMHTGVVAALAKGITPILMVYLFLRVIDLTARNAWGYLFEFPLQGFMFLLEMGLLVIPTFLLVGRGIPSSKEWQTRIIFFSAVLVIFGVVLNRLNVVWFGMIPFIGKVYIPSWQEVVVTLNLISFVVVLFSLAVRYLPLFEPHIKHSIQVSLASQV